MRLFAKALFSLFLVNGPGLTMKCGYDSANIFKQVGTVESRGAELSISGKVTPHIDLVAGGVFIDGKVSEKFGDLAFTHFVWMALVVKQDVAANPIDVGLLGADGIMFHP